MSASAFITGLSVRAPGLAGWDETRPVLAGERPWVPTEIIVPPPALLSSNERRRAGFVARLALAVADEAVTMAGLDRGEVRTVFASANGDGAIVNTLLDTLADPDRPVSPTLFHGSVHNAVAGYWSIGAGSVQPVTCLGCHEATFPAALMKAVAEAAATRMPVLLCAYDAPMPPPLDITRLNTLSFAVALVLHPAPKTSRLARIEVAYDTRLPADAAPRNPALAPLFTGNTAARCLPLLEALACRTADCFALPWLDGALQVKLAP